ncbi:uncharacterized protein LOC133491490 isoform X3 [Syngnathoides biaculeatus]|uniref:uncharacterized protein LOC133491490 isoform X3 n=1 Tax=Syngnathoides biaculeatus TaxID=300417 RepID=UPI002ADE748C|nr:uncharacterized protein LOC133491490 isoform X3 [Syngnathoides biaculeatus]
MYLTLSGNGSRAARTEGATSILTRARTWIQSDIMLLPTEGDRIITRLPKCFSPKASLRTDELFHPRVQAACRTRTEDAVSFNVAKVIVVGDVSVGKTSLVSRFCRGAFDKNYKATIGVDFDMERFHVLGVPFSLQLWDTAGQERFKCIASTYYRGAQGEGVGLVRVQTKLLRRAFLFCFCSHHCGLRPEQRELLSPRQAVVGGRHEGERPLQRSSLPRGHQERSQLSRAAGSGGRGSRQDVGRTRSRVLGRVGKVGRRREGFLSPRGLFDLRGQCPLRAGKTKREHDRRHQDLERPAGRAQAGQEEVRLLLM